LDPLRRFINRIRRLFRDEYQVLDRRLGRLEAAWRQQISARGYAIEIMRSFEGRVSHLELEAAEFMMVQLRLAQVESSARQQAWAQAHATERKLERAARLELAGTMITEYPFQPKGVVDIPLVLGEPLVGVTTPATAIEVLANRLQGSKGWA
jgi:hypothetical protein